MLKLIPNVCRLPLYFIPKSRYMAINICKICPEYLNIFNLSNPIHGGGGGRICPLRFFLHNSKMPGDIENKLSDFNFTLLMVILHILSITIVVRCCHNNLLFAVCHIIFWVEKTKKLELFSR